MAGDTKTVHIRVSGRVQGVWFRAWTKENAEALGVGGWVRNRRDGDVEALLHGAPDAVERLLERLHHGPAGAAVAQVAVEPAQDTPATNTTADFTVRPTE